MPNAPCTSDNGPTRRGPVPKPIKNSDMGRIETVCDIPNSFIIPASAKAAYRRERVKSGSNQACGVTLTIDDAQVTHIAPKLVINTINHLYQITIAFGSSLLSRVTSHGEGPFSLGLPSHFVGAPSTASGSRSCSRSVVTVLDECREAGMMERGVGDR